MPKFWRYSSHDETQIRRLSGDLRISPLLAQVLASRGYDNAPAATEFLSAKMMDLHPPEELPGVNEAAVRVLAAINDGRQITVYGDYDVDGVTATSLLYHCLSLSGAKVDYYIPHRLEEGYGLNEAALRQLHEEDPKRLVITVDCGISSVAEAQLARELGLELIITDHHTIGTEVPRAAAVVHPRLPGGDYPFGDLCGAGVAFKLAWAVCQKLGDGKKASPRMREYLKSAVGLAAIGTIADVVPLVGENRVLVKYGLVSLPELSSVGLRALMKIANIGDQGILSSEDIGFSIAPRINAAGRLGQARLAVELLVTESQDRANALADYLDQLNKQRQTVERRILKQAKEKVAENEAWNDHRALVIADAEWHPGVIGIVANRVAEHFQKPTILISEDRQVGMGQGSGRSYAGFNLYEGLAHCREKLLTFGGHAAAAGLRINLNQIDDFRELFCSFVAENHEVHPQHEELTIDAEVTFQDLTKSAVNELDKLGPFGQQNRRPLFAATHVELAEPPRKMGGGERHLSLKLRQFGRTIRAVAFGKGDWADEISAVDGPLSIAFAPNINRYRGMESVQLQLLDWQSPENAPAPRPNSAASVST